MSNDNVMHAIDLGVAALREQVADLESRVAAYKQVKKQDEFAINQRDENIAKRDEQLVFVRKQRQEAEQALAQRDDWLDERGKELAEMTVQRNDWRASATSLENCVVNYITELESARDAERIKSTKVALGHVVERLRSIAEGGAE